MRFRQWLENKTFTGITPDQIKWWSNYAANLTFPTEQAAKDWVFARKERADKEPASALFGVDGPQYNRAFADSVPIYQSGKSFKIGKRIRNDNRLRLNQLEVRKPGAYELNMAAQASALGEYDFIPLKWIPIKGMIDDKDVYATQQKEVDKIKNLAGLIKSNGWIEAIIYGIEEDGVPYIIEGQHRTRAMKLLGFNTVPGIGIKFY